MELFATHHARTKVLIDTASAFLSRGDGRRALVELERLLEDALALAGMVPSLELSGRLSQYGNLVKNLLWSVNQRQQAVERRAEVMQSVTLIFPSGLLSQSLALSKMAAVKILWNYQLQLLASGGWFGSQRLSKHHKFERTIVNTLLESFCSSPSPSRTELLG